MNLLKPFARTRRTHSQVGFRSQHQESQTRARFLMLGAPDLHPSSPETYSVDPPRLPRLVELSNQINLPLDLCREDCAYHPGWHVALLGARGTQQRYRQALRRGRIVEGVRAIFCAFLSRGSSSVLSRDVMTCDCDQPPGVRMHCFNVTKRLLGPSFRTDVHALFFLLLLLNAIISYMQRCLRYQGIIM